MKRRAFTLLEALITSFMLSIVLGMLVVLLRNGSVIMQHGDARDRTLAGFETAIQAVRGDIEASSVITQLGTDLILSRVNPGQTGRLTPPTGTVDWTSYSYAFLMTVHYYKSPDGILMRQVTTANGTGTLSEYALADGLTGFDVESVANAPGLGPVTGLYEIKLSFQERQSIHDLHSFVASRLNL